MFHSNIQLPFRPSASACAAAPPVEGKDRSDFASDHLAEFTFRPPGRPRYPQTFIPPSAATTLASTATADSLVPTSKDLQPNDGDVVKALKGMDPGKYKKLP